jgi:hypothetical protein
MSFGLHMFTMTFVGVNVITHNTIQNFTMFKWLYPSYNKLI